MNTLVCFGDSITADETFWNGTQRLTPRLQEQFSNWKVENAGVPGDNTFDALKRIEEDVLSYKPTFVMVFLVRMMQHFINKYHYKNMKRI